MRCHRWQPDRGDAARPRSRPRRRSDQRRPGAAAAGPRGRRTRPAAVRRHAEPDAARRLDEACDQLSYDDLYGLAARGNLTELDSVTLDVEGSAAVSQPPRALVVTPDGGHAYLLAGRRALIGIDLTAGTADLSVEVPGYSVSLAVAGERLYVPDAFGERRVGDGPTRRQAPADPRHRPTSARHRPGHRRRRLTPSRPTVRRCVRSRSPGLSQPSPDRPRRC